VKTIRKRERTEKTRKEKQKETRERQGRESHKNDTVKSKENTEARPTTPPAQHAFIAIIFVILGESISRRRERT
jgi:glucan phosphoethanolaminetransferase (alkaline phosphatase superfamily)